MSDEAPLKAMLAVPTRGYVWFETAKQIGKYDPIYYREKLSVANVRNKIVADFLNDKWGHRDLLFMIDDDVIPQNGWAELLSEAPYDIVAAPVPMAKMPDLPVVLNIFNKTDDGRWITAQLPDTGHIEVDGVGTGLIMVRRHVLEHPELTQPFLQELGPDGTIYTGQDLNFCIRAKKLGFTVGAVADCLCDHFTNVHLNSIPYVYGRPDNASPIEE